ncbi:hypothetical protein [Leptospira barantonii]|uniref:Lipoprotein n=1 Tax=Leptospira barantonii TaxID=2023184 RepID=A0ABX4NQS1_9LEPT|nr:hypothetical protein [Leptospira barantonii]PJZ59186.1 hypothetical protein CH367_03970 [Leptospira barantonii]
MKKAKITILLILLCTGCQSDKIDIVSGKDAIERISKEISVISTFESFGSPKINNTTCNVGTDNSTPYSLTNDTNPNETYSTAQSISLQYPQFSRAKITGNISSPTDKDVFVFTNNVFLYGQFSQLTGAAACKISYGVDETMNNSFFPGGITIPLVTGTNAVSRTIASNPWDAVYIGCEGATGQDYTLQVDYNATGAFPNSSTTSGVSPAGLNLFTSHLIFIEAMGIEKSKTYTTDSMNRCIDAIRTKGFIFAIANYNRNFSLCASNRTAYEAERIMLLSEDCTLKPAKVTPNKIYGTGE